MRGTKSLHSVAALTGMSLPFTYKHAFQSSLAKRWLEHILNDLQRQVGLKPTAVTTFIKLSQRGVFAALQPTDCPVSFPV
jgi:hypothetical protein